MEEKSKQPFQILEKTGQLLPEDYLRLRQLARFKLQQFGPTNPSRHRSAHLAWLRLEAETGGGKRTFFCLRLCGDAQHSRRSCQKCPRQLPMADIDSHMLEQIQTAEDCEDPQILAMHEVLQQLEQTT